MRQEFRRFAVSHVEVLGCVWCDTASSVGFGFFWKNCEAKFKTCGEMRLNVRTWNEMRPQAFQELPQI